MIRAIIAPLLGLATAAGAQECVYKDNMTVEEISACRDAPPAAEGAKPASKHGGPTPEQEAVYRAHVAAENARAQQRKRFEETPVTPHGGMTMEEARAMVDANEARRRAYDKAHPVWAGGGSPGTGYDIRWGQWSSCHVNRTTTTRIAHEQWVCGGTNDRRYMYFDNSVLTSIQD